MGNLLSRSGPVEGGTTGSRHSRIRQGSDGVASGRVSKPVRKATVGAPAIPGSGLAVAQGPAGSNTLPNSSGLRRTPKKRKVALFVGFNGTGYYGMQINPNVRTIEGELLKALVDCDLIDAPTNDAMQDAQWARAARTDKGVSAACQCVSLRIPIDFRTNQRVELVKNLNARLPHEIRVFDIRRATAGFNSRTDCFRRRYEYIFPLSVLMDTPHADGEQANQVDSGQGGDPRVARLNSILAKYEGTHCFANFTEGLKGSEDAAKRYMVSVRCSEPFRPQDCDELFCAVRLHGQSFVLYQIRKMVGLALAAYLGYTPVEAVDVALSPYVRIPTPTAPALGLFLDSLEFRSYNAGAGRDLPEPIEVTGNVESQKTEFKESEIYTFIAKQELRTKTMKSWLMAVKANLKHSPKSIMEQYEKYVRTQEGVEEERKQMLAKQYHVTKDRAEFLGLEQHDTKLRDDIKALNSLIESFESVHKIPARCAIRAPGRVNLIGEHCDYNDFPVIGVATRQGTMVVGSYVLEQEVRITHMEHESLGPGKMRTNGELLAAQAGGTDDAGRDLGWIRYVSWGWKAAFSALGTKKRNSGGSGARIIVSGNLPRAAGLGSSSSLVTAAALTAARMNRYRTGREEVALLAAEGERNGAGTRGGAVDHTVSMCGQKGSAVYVAFSPKLETMTVPLPSGASFVVVDSGVKAFKGLSDVTKNLFNTRVAECRVGAAIAARRLRTHLGLTVSTPGQLFNMALAGGQVQNVESLLKDVMEVIPRDEEVSAAEASNEIAVSDVEFANRFCIGINVDGARFRIGRRLRHVLSEAHRVQRFRKLLQEQPADSDSNATADAKACIELGAILSESHVSLRDDYECSCAEVDELVEYCLLNKSLGTRITGAGWGGCILSLVPTEHLSTFQSALEARVGAQSVFVVEPWKGAAVLSL